jgi:hypothetical protein
MGVNPDIIFSQVHNPRKLRDKINEIQDKINEIKEYQEKAKKIKDENEQKESLDKWFSSVFSNYEGIY